MRDRQNHAPLVCVFSLYLVRSATAFAPHHSRTTTSANHMRSRHEASKRKQLYAWNGGGSYLDSLSVSETTTSSIIQSEETMDSWHDEMPYSPPHEQSHNDYAGNEASMDSQTSQTPSWTSSAWQSQHETFHNQHGGVSGDFHSANEVVATDFAGASSTDAEALHHAVEKHTNYFFPQYTSLDQATSEPVHDWSTQVDDITRRIEMASQYTLTEPGQAASSTTDAMTENNEIKEYLNEYSPSMQQTYHGEIQPPTWQASLSSSLPLTDEESREADIESQLDDFEERALRLLSTEIGYKTFLGQNTHSLTEAPIGQLVSRFIDTIEDAIIHWRRLPYKLGLRELPGDSEARPTVVVLGTGWGAHAFCKVACTFDLRIVVVSPVNHFVFTPMLASAAVGTVEYRSMTEAIRSSNPTIYNYIEGKAVDIDPTNKELTVELTALQNSLAGELEDEGPKYAKLDYDYLVCAVGTSVRSGMVPGATGNCFNLKTTQDSKLLRTAIGEALEYASRPDVRGDDPASVAERRRRARFCIIGGGPTGVELAGELKDFLKQICKPRKGAYGRLKDDVSVMLVHGGSELLPQFDKELRGKALQSLQKAGIEVRLNTRSTEVGKTFIRLKEKGDNTVEEEIPVGLTVWGAGNSPAPFVERLLSKLPPEAAGTAGRVNVDRWLRCPTPTEDSFGSILVLGDAACMQTDPQDPSTAYPQTAQVAGQQGAFAARLLNRDYQLHETPPRLAEDFDGFSKLRIWLFARGLDESPEFTFLNLGILAYVGSGEALAQVQLGDVPLFNYAGNVAFALWRSVYLVKQVATRNRALILFDWLKSELFGRDITRL